MALENATTQVISLLPESIATKIFVMLQAIGGIFLLYLIFLGIRFYVLRKEFNMIREMRKDIIHIKKRLSGKKK